MSPLSLEVSDFGPSASEMNKKKHHGANWDILDENFVTELVLNQVAEGRSVR